MTENFFNNDQTEATTDALVQPARRTKAALRKMKKLKSLNSQKVNGHVPERGGISPKTVRRIQNSQVRR